MVIRRFFGTSMPSSGDSPKAGKLTLEQIRQLLHNAISDCGGMRAQRVTYKISGCRTAGDLWLLRSDLHQCISQEHSQSVAAERINGLIPAFAGWLPASQLTRI